MSSAPEPLKELFLALFDSGSELRRFLTLSGFEAVEHRLPVRKGDSIRTVAPEAAAALQDLGLVQPSLFEALARRAPERADDIWGAARFYGIESEEPRLTSTGDEPELAPPPEPTTPPSPAPPDMEAVPAEYATFIAELEAELDANAPVDADEEAMSPGRWPWTGAAAVLGGFGPAELRPFRDQASAEESALTALAQVVFTSADGRWVLEDAIRSRALQRLAEEGALKAALDANAGLPDSHRDWIRRLVSHESLPSIASLDTRELSVLDTVTRWLEPLDLDLAVPRATIYAATERRSLIDPLRKLVGVHFRGRVDELARIERHVRGEGSLSTMVIFGPGGSGKSSLLGKVLLELEDRMASRPLLFAYVDFDKPRHDPRNPLGLVEQIARQLRLVYAANPDAGRDFSAVEAVAAGTDVATAASVLDLGSAQLDLDTLIRELALRIASLPRAYPTPLVLIFDTFEEVQVQGPGAVNDVRELVAKFLEALPAMRVIVSGRGNLRNLVDGDPEATLILGDLDRAAAESVLQSRGVADPEIRELIYQRFGGNPLTLHLAAEALEKTGTAERAFKGVLAQADALAAVGIEQVQGMLYDRILGHLRDPEVVKIAQPGLAVRRVDVDVIRDVLSVPCKLDPSRAATIFERLQREVSMFEPDDDGALRHRQDVRRLMLRAMMDDPRVRPTVAEIHRLAVAFYEPRDGPKARAEEIYHRLMTGQDPRSLQELWSKAPRESLFSALEDPLPEAARAWLSRRLGLVPDDDERAGWEHEDWEAEAEDRARSWLASGDAARAAEVLAERTRRLPGSRLYPLDVTVRIGLGRLDEAAEILEEGMRSSIEAHAVDTQLELAEQGIRLEIGQKDAVGVVAATEAAVRLDDLTDDKVRGITALTGSVDALQEMGAADESRGLAGNVARRFSSLSAEVLRANPELVRTVVQTIGTTYSSVLTRAAVSLGDSTSEQEAVFRDDVFTLGRLLESTVPEARPAMNELATEVGLPADRWSPRELAASAVERGRTGKAVVLALDYAAQEDTTRQIIVNDLVRPAAVA